MERYLCIHGHFYQPPRENPWLEAIEVQDSAYPYHDWNERITAECYAPNTAARILDGEGWILRIVNNYARISFNIGPTLLSWLQREAPTTYQAILAADRQSRERFSGHGSALAQAYNHMIMPLANARDKRTQVIWGLRDFEYRFDRPPEGMWLPETAVDLETLAIMAEHGIRFTILAPYQARRVRRLGDTRWEEVGPGGIDPSRAYQVRLPGNQTMALFFYDGPLSRAVAFEGLLSNGEHFARRLLSGFHDGRTWPQLVHIATDGETYGHHHAHGDMALAYALDHVESSGQARLTNYGEFLERHPPTHEVQIHENTAWSCAHGVGRWQSNCGCNTGGGPGWHQEWRGPLREALNWLRDELAPRYEALAGGLLRDPWAARDDYISVVFDRSPEEVERFFDRHAARALDAAEQTAALRLLELQRHAMLMFTSCGWFFDELSGLEPVQVLQYAARAIQLARALGCSGPDGADETPAAPSDDTTLDPLEDAFLARLERAPSNIDAYGNGRRIYEQCARTTMVDLKQVGAHYAVSSAFEAYPARTAIYCYTADLEDFHRLEAGRASLVLGRARLTSEITRESALLAFAVLHLGDHNLSAGVRAYRGPAVYMAMVDELREDFLHADLPAVLRRMDRHFGTSTYSLRSLFRDEQRKILRHIMEAPLVEAEAAYRQVFRDHAPLMRFLADVGTPLPRALRTVADYILNVDLRHALEDEEADLAHVHDLVEQTRLWRVDLDVPALRYALRRSIRRLTREFLAYPEDVGLLRHFEGLMEEASALPFDVDLWEAQGAYYTVLRDVYPDYRTGADQGDRDARTWLEQFRALGERLKVRVG